MTSEQGAEVAGFLQDRLSALNDLALTLKHIRWNVVGPHVIAVHALLDPLVEAVRKMVEVTAERIATLGVAPLGVAPLGTPGALVKGRSWDDYSLLRADAIAHLCALDLVYQGVIADHRAAADAAAEPDPSATTC